MTTARLAFCALLTLSIAPAALAEDMPPPSIPDGARGFAGQLAGTVARVWDKGLLIERTEVVKSWKHSKAKAPRSLDGRRLLINLRWEQHGEGWRVVPRQRRWLATAVKPGQRLVLDVANQEGERLHLMELDEEQRAAVRGGARGEREGKARPAREGLPRPGLPAGIRGFSGRVAGLAVLKGRGEALFLITDIKDTWKKNEAPQPREAVWRAVRITAGNERHAAFLSTLVPGEDYAIELVHRGGDALEVLELSERQREAADAAR